MLRIMTLIAIALVAASCAGNTPQVSEQNAAATPAATDATAASAGTTEGNTTETMAGEGNGPKMICKREKPIGSNIGQRVCRPVGAVSPTREGDQEEFRRVQGLSDDDRRVSGE